MRGWREKRSHSPQCSLQVDMYCTGLAVEMCLCENSKCFQIGLDTLCFYFAYFLMLCSHPYYACEVIFKLC